MVEIILLALMVDDNGCIGDSAVLGDAPDIVIGEKKDSVGGNSGTFFSLRQTLILQVPKVD
jgi:hypothetical protein